MNARSSIQSIISGTLLKWFSVIAMLIALLSAIYTHFIVQRDEALLLRQTQNRFEAYEDRLVAVMMLKDKVSLEKIIQDMNRDTSVVVFGTELSKFDGEFPVRIADNEFGTVYYRFTTLSHLYYRTVVYTIAVIAVALFSLYFCYRVIKDKLYNTLVIPLTQIASTVSAEEFYNNPSSTIDVQQMQADHVTDEVHSISTAINKMKLGLQDTNSRLLELTNIKSKMDIALQVEHDIRSPLAALSSAVQMLEQVPEDRRILIRQAVQRIEDIANDLALRNSKIDSSEDDVESKQLSPQMVSGILDLIVSEKRMQFRSRGDIRIDCNMNDKSYGLFANLHENTFKRVFSNLINNAVEAVNGSGHIQVNLLPAGDDMLIQVIDNGCGIAADILPTLTQKGQTHNKKNGSGLGLYHARQTIEEWHGRISISSEIGRGTTVEIYLPRVIAPDWFLPELKIDQDTRIIVIDDDNSIHHIWNDRFNAPVYRQNQIVHFSSAKSVLESYTNDPKRFQGNVVILCDLELREESVSGIDLIKQIGSEDKAILVTSRFEDKHVRSECRKLGMKMIPKNLAGFVPISILDSLAVDHSLQSNIDAVLIDDQEMIHTSWQAMAEFKNINLKSFYSAEEFFRVCGKLDKNAKIFIDSNLSDGVKGEEVAKRIHETGFKRIYLATGARAENFKCMPWIQKVVGKRPNFDA